MNKWIITLSSLVTVWAFSSAAHAVVVVPEIDGGSAAVALGLTVGLVALIKEHRGKK